MTYGYYNRCCCPCYCCRPCVPCIPCLTVPGTLTLTKRYRDTGALLPGATYTLYLNGQPVQSAVSDAGGTLTFANLASGVYELVETGVPDGYALDPYRHAVLVNPDGSVLIDGRSAQDAALYDEAADTLTFQKIDGDTGASLPGASFRLSSGATAVSDPNGIVDFGRLAPGTYTLTETAAPDGYQPVATSHTVVAASDGSVTIDGVPAAQFTLPNTPAAAQADRPVIISITETDRVVTGTGTPGATVTVTFPDGTQEETGVNADGTWSVPVPGGTALHAGDTVYAHQTVPGYLPSDDASFLVQARA